MVLRAHFKQQILRFMDKKPHGTMFNLHEIADGVNSNSQRVSKYMKELREEKRIRMVRTRGNSWGYFLMNNLKREALVDTRDHSDVQIRAIKPGSLDRLAENFAKARWDPKIVKSSRNLPLGLARLYLLAVEIQFGSAVDQTDLNDVRYSFNEFREDLRTVLSLIDSILVNPDLWEPTKFAPLLLANGHDPEFYRSLAQRIKEHN